MLFPRVKIRGSLFLVPSLGLYSFLFYFFLFILLNSDVSVFVLSYLTFIDYYHLEAHLFSKKKQGVNQDGREMEEKLKELG